MNSFKLLLYLCIVYLTEERKTNLKSKEILPDTPILKHFIFNTDYQTIDNLNNGDYVDETIFQSLVPHIRKNGKHTYFSYNNMFSILRNLVKTQFKCQTFLGLNDLDSFWTKDRTNLVNLYFNTNTNRIKKLNSARCYIEFCGKMKNGKYKISHLNQIDDCIFN